MKSGVEKDEQKQNQGFWKRLSYVKRSKQRKKVLKTINGDNLMPSEIADRTQMHQSHVSRALNQLKDKNLVQLMNPEAKTGRIYQITDEGQKVLDEIQD